ncbi:MULTISPECIES: hypothetical protein [unclassified Paenibacillus]|uniref:hypothetical protein n=1 Tax=unclassified Paenibacillus TaxID=185978 RepID=UPI000896D8C2|nr:MULTISPECIES: hypothetical protein [unclassified Paenibacillus]SDW54438.1 hypothetical protein SAMN05518848_102112 [Paenibacillus sp. PDC88]
MKKHIEVVKITQQLGITIYMQEGDLMPKAGELGFCQRYGFGVVSEISECGWWYYFEGGDVAVNKPSVRKATESEINTWRDKQCQDL